MTQQKNSFKGFNYQGNMVVGTKQFNAPLTYQDSLINEARLVFVNKGHSTLICAGQTLHLKPGDTLLMKADNFINHWHGSSEHKEGVGDQKAVDFIGFRFTQRLLQSIYQQNLPEKINQSALSSSPMKAMAQSAVVLSNNALLKGFFHSLQPYMHSAEKMNDALIALKVKELIELLLLEDHSNQISQAFRQLFVPSQPVLQEVVKTHLFTPLKVDELAFLCHMSASTFNRKFKQQFGTSANKYLISKRLEKAEQLIKATDKSLTLIAQDCGFDELCYFSRMFKQHYQVSPSALRKV